MNCIVKYTNKKLINKLIEYIIFDISQFINHSLIICNKLSNGKAEYMLKEMSTYSVGVYYNAKNKESLYYYIIAITIPI